MTTGTKIGTALAVLVWWPFRIFIWPLLPRHRKQAFRRWALTHQAHHPGENSR